MMTDLTLRQHRALDRLSTADESARVIGWILHREAFMPVVDSPGLTALFAVDRRGAMKPPTPYWFTGYNVNSNMQLKFDGNDYGVERK